VPEKRRTSYLMNLVDQILGALGVRGLESGDPGNKWAFTVTDYLIVE